MKIPFTRQEFLGVFEHYNQAVWPAQFVLMLFGVLAVIITLKKFSLSVRASFLVLSLLWLWMGLGYHLVFFSTINPAAVVFGGFFILQAIAFFYFGVLYPAVSTDPLTMWRKQVALGILVYSLLIYPVLGLVAGHAYPAVPTFGVPCPTAIFTFGLLMLLPVRLPWWMTVIPLLWSVIGFSAAMSLSMPEDFGLMASGLIFLLSRVAHPHSVQVN